MFKEKNNQINLSSLRDDESIIEKHFIDSLMLTKFIQLS
jgi:16S rRNA G527 N7-methylase RsmG